MTLLQSSFKTLLQLTTVFPNRAAIYNTHGCHALIHFSIHH